MTHYQDFWVDSHCNFEDPRLSEDMPAILQRAREAQIGHIVNICSKASQFDTVLAQAEAHDMLSCTIGIHPHHAGEEAEVPFTAADLVARVKKHPKIVAIGETGLDYHYNRSTPEAQRASFRKHIQAALETGLPIIIHAREADDEIMQIVREEAPNGELKGILHCFSSGRGLAEAGIDYGLSVSFSGIATFKNAHDVREIARDVVPLERLLIETDAPYLAPVPLRGRVCEPSFIIHTAHVLAELKQVSIDDIRVHTTMNFLNLFSRVKDLWG